MKISEKEISHIIGSILLIIPAKIIQIGLGGLDSINYFSALLGGVFMALILSAVIFGIRRILNKKDSFYTIFYISQYLSSALVAFSFPIALVFGFLKGTFGLWALLIPVIIFLGYLYFLSQQKKGFTEIIDEHPKSIEKVLKNPVTLQEEPKEQKLETNTGWEVFVPENPHEKKEKLPIKKIVESKPQESKPRIINTKPNFCGDCGASLASAKNFCANCGKKLLIS
tara:strand:- start:171 stop:848 length:678 start_codon:yes stop_codon:yes gene_type:complete